jgi:hypothetical protein
MITIQSLYTTNWPRSIPRLSNGTTWKLGRSDGGNVDLVENIATVTFDETEVTSETLQRVVAGTKHEPN